MIVRSIDGSSNLDGWMGISIFRYIGKNTNINRVNKQKQRVGGQFLQLSNQYNDIYLLDARASL